jgi:hypothetical protein
MDTPCIEWTKSKCRGYGQLTIKGRHHKAHRLAYVQAHGLQLDDIKGMHVRHRCDNPACVNPEHLELGTHADNMRDMAERGRSRPLKGEQNKASKLTAQQVAEIRSRYIPGDRANGSRALAREYGVGHRGILNVIHQITWKP